MDLLHAPFLLHEFRGEPVEQFGVGGWTAFATEVEDSGNESTSEVPGPEVIHGDSCCEGISRVCDPVCECRASPGAGGGERFAARLLGLKIVLECLERAGQVVERGTGLIEGLLVLLQCLLGFFEFFCGLGVFCGSGFEQVELSAGDG